MKSLFVVTLMTSLALAGCSSSGSDGCGEQDANGAYVVCMTSAFTFEPKTLEVPVGATVTWRFDGGGAHDTEAASGEWKSPLLRKAGETWSHTFNEAGSFSYRCNPHVSNGMSGTIIVTA